MPLPDSRTTTTVESRLIIEQWASEIRASKKQTRQILLLLDKEHLLRKAVRKGLKRVDIPRGLRFLFCYYAAKILGWRQRIEEGHPSGFSAAINEALRLLVWPDSACSSAAAAHGLAAACQPQECALGRHSRRDGAQTGDSNRARMQT